jgi:hypothetical protein
VLAGARRGRRVAVRVGLERLLVTQIGPELVASSIQCV